MHLTKKNNVMIKLLCLTMGLIASINACKNDENMDDVLSIKRMPYTGSELRTGGYYYNEYIEGYYTVYFFYQNGVVLYGSSFPINELSEQESQYKNGTHYKYAESFKYYWGVFQVEGDKIAFERWYPSQPPLKVLRRSGIILNDSTFQITKSMRTDGSNAKDINELYHFKAFSPKPDSVNKFIK